MITTYDVLTPEQVERIDREVLRILEEVGVHFEYQPALDVLGGFDGVKIENNIAYFQPDFVKAKIAEAPSEFTLAARDPEKTVTCGGRNLILTPSYGPPFVYEADGTRRQSVMEDYINVMKLVQTSEHINHSGGNVIEPNDIDTHITHLKMLEAHVRYCDKPFMGSAHGIHGAKDSIEIAKIIFGDEETVKNTPILNTLINSISPLTYDERMLGAMMTYAEYGQSSMVSALVMSGSTGPVTMVETLALQIAETLAGIVLAQCVRSGAPCIIGSTSGPADMRSMSLSIGTAETALYTAATAQIARYYGIPSRGGGGLNDGVLCDAQIGYESMLTLGAAVSSEINFVLHAAGIMQYYNAFSYEKFIIDEEIAGLTKKFKEGYIFDEDRFVFDDVKEVGPSGHFLYEDSTMEFMGDLRMPVLSFRSTYEEWEETGSKSASQRATDLWHKRLDEYVQPEMDPQMDKELTNFIKSKTEN